MHSSVAGARHANNAQSSHPHRCGEWQCCYNCSQELVVVVIKAKAANFTKPTHVYLKHACMIVCTWTRLPKVIREQAASVTDPQLFNHICQVASSAQQSWTRALLMDPPHSPSKTAQLDRISRFSTMHGCYRRTDGQTDRPTEQTRNSVDTIEPLTLYMRRGLLIRSTTGQGRSDEGGISVYYTPKISLPYKFLCGYWLFFSLTQDKFDIVPVCALARVSFTYILTHHNLYPPPNEIPGYAPATGSCSSRRSA